MERHGVTCAVEVLQQHVNEVFHDMESDVYDVIHQEMWHSLPVQFDLLAADVLAQVPLTGPLRLLDVGAGTGLSSELLLRSPMGKAIGAIDLLDTSPRMLDKALARSRSWNVPCQGRVGSLDDFTPQTFDLILICSVLHHIPHLPGFLAQVARVQKTGGILLHLVDPNGDVLNDPELTARCEEFRRFQEERAPRPPSRLQRFHPKRILRRLFSWREPSYVDRVNERLIALGIIHTPLSDEEMWTITDIHDFTGDGISLVRLREWLEHYELVSSRSFAFYGRMAYNLPTHLAERETQFSLQNLQNGKLLSAAWRKVK